MLNAANRDPVYFRNPDTFETGRQKSGHIAFDSGIHFCVGAILFRPEGQIVFDALRDKAPSMRLVHNVPAWDFKKLIREC